MATLSEQKLIVERHQKSWPVPVVPIAKDLGLAVYRRSNWSGDISGRIFRSEELGGASGYAIEVNDEHADVRRRFTIAHEIAHFILHRGLIGESLADDGLYRSGLSNAVERQANKFAQRILMPDHLIQQALAQFGADPVVMAQQFQVSEAAMRIRLGLPPSYNP